MRHAPLIIALLCSACSNTDGGGDAAAVPSQESAAPAPIVQASQAEPEPARTPDPNALGPEGLGDIVVGQAPPASLKADSVQISDGCRTHTDRARGIYAMTDGKVVTRVTAMRASKVATAQGIAIGATEAQVRQAYPDAGEEPHKYVEAPAKYLDWRPNGKGEAGVRFEIDAQGKVSAIHAGRDPHLSYVEGCA
jgi:hypothetical protein